MEISIITIEPPDSSQRHWKACFIWYHFVAHNGKSSTSGSQNTTYSLKLCSSRTSVPCCKYLVCF